MSHGKGGPSRAPEFVSALKSAGFNFFAGVPCSLLKGLVSILDEDPDAHYVSATREDSAVGMAMFSAKGARTLTDVYGQLRETKTSGAFHEADSLRGASFTDLLQELVDRSVDVQAVDVYKGWLEIDTFDDYRRAWALLKE